MSEDEFKKELLTETIEPMLHVKNTKDGMKEIYYNLEWLDKKSDEEHNTSSIFFEILIEYIDNEDDDIKCRCAKIIRKIDKYTYISDVDILIEKLVNNLHRRNIEPAREAALTLGYLMNTRPLDENLSFWNGYHPRSKKGIKDIDQRGVRSPIIPPSGKGVLDSIDNDIKKEAIDELVENLWRKKYKRSKDLKVSKACAQSIGFIGYTSPETVRDAVEQLKKMLSENIGPTLEILYALTSIGYSRPDLIGGKDFKEKLEKVLEENRLPPWIKPTIEVGIYKIGHAPSWIEMAFIERNQDVRRSFDKIFRFMLGRVGSVNQNVWDAAREITNHYPEDVADVLEKELLSIVDGNIRTPDFPANFMNLLKKLTEEELIRGMLIRNSKKIFEDRRFIHYWFEYGTEILTEIFQRSPEQIPEDLEKTLEEFIEEESRHSVVRNCSELLETIR